MGRRAVNSQRVLMVSPHFPPDNGAASHRVRLLAPHLPEFGWLPTVVTVDPRYYEGRLDPELLSLVPSGLDVVRVPAWSVERSRRFGFGDLGLRAFTSLRRECRDLAKRRRFHCFFVTIYPTYPALLGPLMKRRARLPFVLDYQDPWVGEWGRSTGPGENGLPDARSRLSRAIASRLEPIAVAAADGITSVSDATYETVLERIPRARPKVCETIPLGGEATDFAYLRSNPRPNPFFGPADGKFHLSYVGTLLPLGVPILRSVLRAVGRLKQDHRPVYDRLRLHFIGTSNQSTGPLQDRVMPEAAASGVAEIVQEVSARAAYIDALNVLTQSNAILLMGSVERHYTASKLYPALSAGRPILAVFHEDSSVVSILSRAMRHPTARVVTYGGDGPGAFDEDRVHQHLLSMIGNPVYDAGGIDPRVIEEFSSRAMAERLARVLTRVSLPQ
ncbi:MAG: glycosyltransferase [Vicinamibacteria bacterium]